MKDSEKILRTKWPRPLQEFAPATTKIPTAIPREYSMEFSWLQEQTPATAYDDIRLVAGGNSLTTLTTTLLQWHSVSWWLGAILRLPQHKERHPTAGAE